MDVLEYAKSRETDMVKLYKNLAEQSSQESIRKVFLALAEEEAEQFYLMAARNEENPVLQEVFRWLAKQEGRHREVLGRARDRIR
ncbi:MAG: ferritin family protein [Elusimicrobiota bacterium]